jgi:hypothetical protein
MLRFLYFLLIIGIVGQASIRSVLTLHYQLNRAVYLKKCENKDKPNLHCDGKCYLKKKMGVEKMERSGQPKLPENFQQIKDLQLFCEDLVPFGFLRAERIEKIQLPAFKHSLLPVYIPAVFRPPACC